MDKNEKYLKSIDSTLKEILKELKRQGKAKPVVHTSTVNVSELPDMKKIADEINSRLTAEIPLL